MLEHMNLHLFFAGKDLLNMNYFRQLQETIIAPILGQTPFSLLSVVLCMKRILLKLLAAYCQLFSIVMCFRLISWPAFNTMESLQGF